MTCALAGLILGLINLAATRDTSYDMETQPAMGSISFALTTDTIADCDLGLTNRGVYATLEYRLATEGSNSNNSQSRSLWYYLGAVSIPASRRDMCLHEFTFNFSYCAPSNEEAVFVQFRLVQWEHGGGYCNCWGVVPGSLQVEAAGNVIPLELEDIGICDITGTLEDVDVSRPGCDYTLTSQFCSGSASTPRGFLSPVLNLRTGSRAANSCPIGLDMVIDFMERQNCSETDRKIVISFKLLVPNTPKCDIPDGRDKGIEVSLGNWNNDGYWLPLAYYYASIRVRHQEIVHIGEFDASNNFVRIRGYDIRAKLITSSGRSTIEICDSSYLPVSQSGFQLRWLATSIHPVTNEPPADVWALDDVVVEYVDGNHSQVLIHDTFESPELNETVWNREIRNVQLSTVEDYCGVTDSGSTEGKSLLFGNNTSDLSRDSDTFDIASRMVTTKTLGVIEMSQTLSESVTTSAARNSIQCGTTPEMSTTVATTLDSMSSTANPLTTQSTPETVRTTSHPLTTQFSTPSTVDPLTTHITSEPDPSTNQFVTSAVSTPLNPLTIEEAIRNDIAADPRLAEILDADSLEAVELLSQLTSNTTSALDPLLVVYLMSQIMNGTSLNPSQQTEFTQAFLSIGSNLLDEDSDAILYEADNSTAGSTLLSSMDKFALNTFSGEGSTTVGNITLNVTKERPDCSDDASPIIFRPLEGSAYSLELPRQLLDLFEEALDEEGHVRIICFLFGATTGLLPAELDGYNQTEIASGIISAALQCRSEICPTEDVILDKPVISTIPHTKQIQKKLEEDETATITCVFWEFITDSEEGALSTGRWSETGCRKQESLSNHSLTVCECEHLTHFAILLSAAPLNLSRPIMVSLYIIGYIGVSISEVAMMITALTFIILKPLRNMRNYIHINLCISLGIAQFIFVLGIDQTSDSGDIPLHCQAVAVLLHYFFLVTFMWMLMEGVVLYFILVKVFVGGTKKYMLGFTLTSYCVPLVYVGAVTVPLGFVREGDHYGHVTACFLNPETNFTFAFIVPVVLIFLTNLALFLMAATVMWRHTKRKTGSKLKFKDVKRWLQALLSLAVIMGLTWILGVVIVEKEQLVPLAYIFTFMSAFQGIWIFLVFVVFPEQVREEYHKLWRAKVKKSPVLSRYWLDSKATTQTQITKADKSGGSEDKDSGEVTEEKRELNNFPLSQMTYNDARRAGLV